MKIPQQRLDSTEYILYVVYNFIIYLSFTLERFSVLLKKLEQDKGNLVVSGRGGGNFKCGGQGGPTETVTSKQSLGLVSHIISHCEQFFKQKNEGLK